MEPRRPSGTLPWNKTPQVRVANLVLQLGVAADPVRWVSPATQEGKVASFFG